MFGPKLQLHMMHMRYLTYKDAVVKALRSAHREMVDYSDAVARMLEERKERNR